MRKLCKGQGQDLNRAPWEGRVTYRKPPAAPEWIRVSEAAGRLGCDPRTVTAMINRGDLKVRALRFNGCARIHREDFNRELEKRSALDVSA